MRVSDQLWKELSEETKQFIKEFFSSCPKYVGQAVSLSEFFTGQCVMGTYDDCIYVYILLKGRLRVIEERISENPYHFSEITPVEIVGDYELFMGAGNRYVTLVAAQPSTLLAIQAGAYLSWMRQDANALFLRTRLLMKQITDQGLQERQRFFLDNETRLLSFLAMEYRRESEKCEILKIENTREELAVMIGCSVRTLNRIVKKLSEIGLLTLIHGKLAVNENQYRNIQMKFGAGEE